MSASVSKKIELKLDLLEGLPLIEGDPVQLQQVLLNLVTNAAEAIGEREGTILLRSFLDAVPASEAAAGGSVVVEVTDTGAGMSPEVQARIFDPFFTTKATGRGLGLSTLQGILKAHGGRATVSSQPGEGTTFSLRFPLPDQPVKAAAGSSTGPYALERAEGLVLLVDDEADIRLTAGALLRRMGFEVLEAADGREALSEVARRGEDLRLVILDLSMPRMDGAEALGHIRASRPDLPVILSSGFDPNSRTPDLLKQANTWFLPKPYRLADLRRLVGEVLGA
ncbi:MAG TPA: ATP-binding protein, partial [Holophagaceae bacterium]|nr:ATP-binding protein [Holophagaceae bacterium]